MRFSSRRSREDNVIQSWSKTSGWESERERREVIMNNALLERCPNLTSLNVEQRFYEALIWKVWLWKIGIIFYKSCIHLFGRLRSELCKKLRIKHFTHIVTWHWNKSYETKMKDEKLLSLWVHGYIFHIIQSFCLLFILNIDQCFFKVICLKLETHPPELRTSVHLSGSQTTKP